MSFIYYMGTMCCRTLS